MMRAHLLMSFACALARGYTLSPIRTMHRVAPRATLVMEDTPKEVNVAEQATAAIDSVMGMLGDDMDPPKSLATLKGAIQEGDKLKIGSAMYAVLVEQCLDYEVVDGKLVQPSKLDFKDLESEELKKKMSYVYAYGINMYKMGYIGEEPLKEAIIKIAGRVEMDGPQFDKWLEMPAVA